MDREREASQNNFFWLVAWVVSLSTVVKTGPNTFAISSTADKYIYIYLDLFIFLYLYIFRLYPWIVQLHNLNHR